MIDWFVLCWWSGDRVVNGRLGWLGTLYYYGPSCLVNRYSSNQVMHHDARSPGKPLGHSFRFREYRERTWGIQSYIIPRSSAQQWAQNLRFITGGDKPASEPIRLDSLVVERGVSYDGDYDDDDDNNFNVNSDESSSDGANIRIGDCVRKSPFTSDPKPNGRRRALHLTAAGDVNRCNAYVAVSYRWPKSDNPLDKPLDECFTVHKKTGTGSRTNRAATNVLERAMSFAEHHNYKLIWMDQECINPLSPFSQSFLNSQTYHGQAKKQISFLLFRLFKITLNYGFELLQRYTKSLTVPCITDITAPALVSFLLDATCLKFAISDYYCELPTQIGTNIC